MHLRHDPDAAVAVTEVLQLYVSICGAVDTAIVAYLIAFGAEDTAFFGAWHGGHSLWSLDGNHWSVAAEDFARVEHSSWHLSGAYDLSIFSIVFCLCCKTGSDSRVALLQMQHLLLLLLQQPVFGMLYGHTSSSCILSTLVILCTCCLDCKRLRWPWCCFNTRERERERVIHML